MTQCNHAKRFRTKFYVFFYTDSSLRLRLFLLVMNYGMVTNTTTGPTTFQVSKRKEDLVKGWEKTETERVPAKLSTICSSSESCYPVHSGTEFSGNVRALQNGFVQTVIEAYNGHHNLFLRPDDI